MKTAFVTGSTGFLGLNLVEELLRQQWRVVAFHQAQSDLSHLGKLDVVRRVGTLTDAASLHAALPEGVDAVFHVASSNTMWAQKNAEQIRINVDGTRNLVEAALAKNARRFIYTSSLGAYGEHATRVTEETPSNAERSWINYLRSKWLAECEVRAGIARGLDAVIVNPSGIIGPYDYRNWSRMFQLVATGKLPGVPPGRGSFCHVREVAKAHIAAAERGRRGENYLLGGADASYLEMVQEIGRLLDKPVPSRAMPPLLLRAFGRVAQWGSYVTRKEPDITPEGAFMICATNICADEKAQRELGYKPVPLAQMLGDCHQWMVAEKLLPA